MIKSRKLAADGVKIKRHWMNSEKEMGAGVDYGPSPTLEFDPEWSPLCLSNDQANRKTEDLL
jgi:hypothetical protein